MHESTDQQPSERESRGLPPWLKVSVIVIALGTAVGFLLFGSQASDAFVYSKLVDEVLSNPAQFEGRELRVEGDLKPGSILFREKPCEWRFVLVKQEHELPVSFPQCIVPDTFKDGMGIVVTVQGKLQDDHSFVANQVIPRCPSKYEMEQRMQQGEEMPHGPGAPGEAPSDMALPQFGQAAAVGEP